MNNTWIKRFIEIAWLVASWSKDPRTKVGAIAVDPQSRRLLTTGYNGIPRGVDDLEWRMQPPLKYKWTAHAEENLVANAARDRLEGSTVIVTHLCCSACTRMLINAGVRQVVIGVGTWSAGDEEFEISRRMLHEANVDLVLERDLGESSDDEGQARFCFDGSGEATRDRQQGR